MLSRLVAVPDSLVDLKMTIDEDQERRMLGFQSRQQFAVFDESGFHKMVSRPFVDWGISNPEVAIGSKSTWWPPRFKLNHTMRDLVGSDFELIDPDEIDSPEKKMAYFRKIDQKRELLQSTKLPWYKRISIQPRYKAVYYTEFPNNEFRYLTSNFLSGESLQFTLPEFIKFRMILPDGSGALGWPFEASRHNQVFVVNRFGEIIGHVKLNQEIDANPGLSPDGSMAVFYFRNYIQNNTFINVVSLKKQRVLSQFKLNSQSEYPYLIYIAPNNEWVFFQEFLKKEWAIYNCYTGRLMLSSDQLGELPILTRIYGEAEFIKSSDELGMYVQKYSNGWTMTETEMYPE